MSFVPKECSVTGTLTPLENRLKQWEFRILIFRNKLIWLENNNMLRFINRFLFINITQLGPEKIHRFRISHQTNNNSRWDHHLITLNIHRICKNSWSLIKNSLGFTKNNRVPRFGLSRVELYSVRVGSRKKSSMSDTHMLSVLNL
jgi:hypothetical protein